MSDRISETSTQSVPFHAFTFTYVDGRNPRAFLRMEACADDLFELHVEKGSASRPSFQFTRKVPVETAAKLAEDVQLAGVLGWEELYEGKLDIRWNLRIVFKEGVFTLVSKGVGATPDGFDKLLETLYGIDFPRQGADARNVAPAGKLDSGVYEGGATGSTGLKMTNMSAGDLGAYGAVGGFSDVLSRLGADPSGLAKAFEGMEGVDTADFSRMAVEAAGNPRLFQQQMRDEFKKMPLDQQNQLLDSLASMGMASRSWWERFLRG